MVLAGSCGESEQALGLDEHQHLQEHSASASGAACVIGPQESVIFIAIPETNHVRGIYDTRTCDLVLSMLPDAARGQLEAKGVISIYDAETAAAIAVVAGMEGAEVSGGMWIAAAGSWSCLKCCMEDPPCCSPCPACCEDKDSRDLYQEVP
jgi:hypothetical protein